ncbi:hypothetical protein M2373_004071 [Chryseobacterium sp. JUb7]|nr:hypothetical protein [Chryseobacterium sp. JUb7]
MDVFLKGSDLFKPISKKCKIQQAQSDTVNHTFSIRFVSLKISYLCGPWKNIKSVILQL